MLALLFMIVAAVLFALAALSKNLGDLLLVDWGLFFVALSLLIEPLLATISAALDRRKKAPPA
jgi:hypothetical protein